MQVAICPGESQFLPSPSACQKIQTHREQVILKETEIWEADPTSFPSVSLFLKAEVVIITMSLTWFDSSICAFSVFWSLSSLAKACALNLCLLWFDTRKREKTCKQGLVSPVSRVPAGDLGSAEDHLKLIGRWRTASKRRFCTIVLTVLNSTLMSRF